MFGFRWDIVRCGESLGGNRPPWHHDELCHSISAAVLLCCPLSSSLRFSSAKGRAALTRYNASVLPPKITPPCLSWISHDLWREKPQLQSPVCPSFPTTTSFLFLLHHPPWHCTKHDLRSVSSPAPQCYQQSCWISFSLGLQSPHVQ